MPWLVIFLVTSIICITVLITIISYMYTVHCRRRDSRNERLLEVCRTGSLADVQMFAIRHRISEFHSMHDLDGNDPMMIASKRGRADIVNFMLERQTSLLAKISSIPPSSLPPLPIPNIPEAVLLNAITPRSIPKTDKLNLSASEERPIFQSPIPQKILDMASSITPPVFSRPKNSQTPTSVSISKLSAKENVFFSDIDLISESPHAAFKETDGDPLMRKERNKDGWTSFHLACLSGSVELVETLLMVGKADPNTRTTATDQTPLHIAAMKGFVDICSLVIEYGADVNALDSDSLTPIAIASSNGHVEVVRLLLAKSANYSIQTRRSQETALHMAVKNGWIDVVRVLLALPNRSHIKMEAITGATALHAVPQGAKAILEMLINAGADINAQKKDGSTALHIAAARGDSVIATVLIENGAKVNFPDGQTSPLHDACFMGRVDLVKLLLSHTNGVFSYDSEHQTVLHRALASKYPQNEIIQLLLDNDIDVGVKDAWGNTALHCVLSAQLCSDSLSRMKMILEKASDDVLIAKNNADWTPLHLASSKLREVESQYLSLVNEREKSKGDKNGNKEKVDEKRTRLPSRERKLYPNMITSQNRTFGNVRSTSPMPFNSDVNQNQPLLERCKVLVTKEREIAAENQNTKRHSSFFDKIGFSGKKNKKTSKDPIEVLKEENETTNKSLPHSHSLPQLQTPTMLELFEMSIEIVELLIKRISETHPEFMESFDWEKSRTTPHSVSLTHALDDEQKHNVLNGDVSLQGIAAKISSGSVKNIIVLTGAGVSVSAGIPDFRSPIGIYTKFPSIRPLFEIQGFLAHPDEFFKLAQEMFKPMIERNVCPTAVHFFIKLLHSKGLLLRNYTQNVDDLEVIAGIPEEAVIASHGTLRSSQCAQCTLPTPAQHAQRILTMMGNGLSPKCPLCNGPLKPDIVFFGQPLPERFLNNRAADFAKCDLLIVAGTSLTVKPFSELVNDVHYDVPRLLINNVAVGPFAKWEKLSETEEVACANYRDVLQIGDCNNGFMKLIQLLGWEDDFNKIVSEYESSLKAANFNENENENENDKLNVNESATKSNTDSVTETNIKELNVTEQANNESERLKPIESNLLSSQSIENFNDISDQSNGIHFRKKWNNETQLVEKEKI